MRMWIRMASVAGALYFVTGYVFAALDNTTDEQLRFRLRLAAWILSGVVYAVHIWYERLRLRNSAGPTAFHVAIGVAFGAFLLAVAATIHNMFVPSPAPYWRFLLALVIWPLVTAVPAFIVAFGLAAMLSLISVKRLV